MQALAVPGPILISFQSESLLVGKEAMWFGRHQLPSPRHAPCVFTLGTRVNVLLLGVAWFCRQRLPASGVPLTCNRYHEFPEQTRHYC